MQTRARSPWLVVFIGTVSWFSTHLAGQIDAAEISEAASREHLQAVMQLAEKDFDLAVKQTLDGLANSPATQLWGVELVGLFELDSQRARALEPAERGKHFAKSRDYLSRGLALEQAALKAKPRDESLIHQVNEITSALAVAELEAGNTAEARKLAQARLAANTDENDWNYGNVIHDANALLGRAALRDGNKEAAAAFLLKAGATPGSPQLDSFGPDFTLARELAKAGDSKSVLAYLDLVEKFWVQEPGRKGRSQLSRDHLATLNGWREEIRKGKVPDSW